MRPWGPERRRKKCRLGKRRSKAVLCYDNSDSVPIDPNRLRKDGVYTGEAPLAALRADCATIARADAKFASTRRAIRWTALAIFAAGCAGAVALGGASVGFGFVAAIVLLIWSFRYGGKLTKYRYRYALLGQLPDVLESDASATRPVAIELGLKDRSREIRTEPLPARHGKQVFLIDNWLKVEGRFRDGSYYRQEFAELIRKRTARGSSGKTKTKTRTTYLVITRLAYPAKIYGNAQALGAGIPPAAWKLPASAQVKGFKVTEKAIAAKVLVRNVEELQAAGGRSFLGIYRVLNQARAEVVRQRRGGGST
jgi:hypothetical protein